MKEDYMIFEIFWDLTHREMRGILWTMVNRNPRLATVSAAF